MYPLGFIHLCALSQVFTKLGIISPANVNTRDFNLNAKEKTNDFLLQHLSCKTWSLKQRLSNTQTAAGLCVLLFACCSLIRLFIHMYASVCVCVKTGAATDRCHWNGWGRSGATWASGQRWSHPCAAHRRSHTPQTDTQTGRQTDGWRWHRWLTPGTQRHTYAGSWLATCNLNSFSFSMHKSSREVGEGGESVRVASDEGGRLGGDLATLKTLQHVEIQMLVWPQRAAATFTTAEGEPAPPTCIKTQQRPPGLATSGSEAFCVFQTNWRD